MDHSIKAPDRTTAEVFPQYIGGQIVADSATLKWSGLFARRYQFARVVDGFLVPATAEPLIACNMAGSAEFEEREIGGRWRSYRVRSGDLFVTCSKTPYELRWRSPLGAEIDVIHIHLGVDQCLAAFQMVYQDKAGAVEVTEFFGRDEALAYLSFACAEMLSARTPGNSKRVASFAHFWRFTSPRNTRTSHRRSLIITAAYRSHGSARSRTMSVRTWQRAFRLRSWLN